MIINGFERVSAPMSIQGDTIAGFYNRYDSGAGYIEDISFIGEQVIFDRKLSRSENDNYALGTSYTDYEDRVIAGNSFDYPALHGEDLRSLGYSFCSASVKAVENGLIKLENYPIVDLILGKQRTTSVGRGTMGYRYKVLSEQMQKIIKDYTAIGGDIFISGTFLLTDLWHGAEATESDKAFAEQVLHSKFGGSAILRSGDINTKPTKFSQKRIKLSFNTLPSEVIYPAETPEIVIPACDKAITALQYAGSHDSAAVAYSGDYSIFVMGFPYETIVDVSERRTLLSEILNWLTK
jgi:hypothetical protein